MVYAMLRQQGSDLLSFKFIASALVVCHCLKAIVLLQRTLSFGSLIMMVGHMITELLRFFLTFALVIFLFFSCGRMLNLEIKVKDSSYYQIFMDLFEGING